MKCTQRHAKGKSQVKGSVDTVFEGRGEDRKGVCRSSWKPRLLREGLGSRPRR